MCFVFGLYLFCKNPMEKVNPLLKTEESEQFGTRAVVSLSISLFIEYPVNIGGSILKRSAHIPE